MMHQKKDNLPVESMILKDFNIRWTLNEGPAFSKFSPVRILELHMKKLELCYEVFSCIDDDITRRMRCSIKSIEIQDKVETSKYRFMLHKPSPKGDFLSVDLLTKKVSEKKHTKENYISITPSNVNVNVDADTMNKLQVLWGDITMCKTQTSLIEDYEDLSDKPSKRVNSNSFFIRSFSVTPPVTVQISFSGNYRKTISTLLNIAAVDKMDLVLNSIQTSDEHDIRSCIELLFNHWMKDIFNNQKMNVATGSSHIRAMVDIPKGIAGLITEPIICFLQNGSIVAGLTSGGEAFKRLTLSPILCITGHGLIFFGVILDFIRRCFSKHDRFVMVKGPPASAIEGVREGTDLLCNELHLLHQDVMNTARRTPSTAHALGTVAARVPEMVLAPMASCATMAGLTLTGTGHQMLPGSEQELKQKYKSHM